MSSEPFLTYCDKTKDYIRVQGEVPQYYYQYRSYLNIAVCSKQHSSRVRNNLHFDVFLVCLSCLSLLFFYSSRTMPRFTPYDLAVMSLVPFLMLCFLNLRFLFANIANLWHFIHEPHCFPTMYSQTFTYFVNFN